MQVLYESLRYRHTLQDCHVVTIVALIEVSRMSVPCCNLAGYMMAT